MTMSIVKWIPLFIIINVSRFWIMMPRITSLNLVKLQTFLELLKLSPYIIHLNIIIVWSTAISLHQAHDMSPKWVHLMLLTNWAPSPLPGWTWPELPTLIEQPLRCWGQGIMSWENPLTEQLLVPGASSKRVMSVTNSGSHPVRNIAQRNPSTWKITLLSWQPL